MRNFLFIIAFLIVLTTVIIGTNPQLHKPLAIGGAQIAVSNKDIIQNSDIKVSNQDSIKNTEKVSVKTTKQIKNINNISTTAIEADKNMEKLLKAQAEEDAKAKKETFKIVPTKESHKTATKISTKPAKQVTTQNSKTSKTVTTTKPQTKPAQQPAVQKNVQEINEQEVKKQVQKILTEYEETILWNQWRAKVANRVADNLDPYFAHIIPLGTIYRYDFNVNNKGQVSNIRVRVTKGYINANTNQGAVMIQNSIKSLNGNSILAFPNGTQRSSVTVSSGIERTQTSQPINENAFNDAETIIKQIYQNAN